MRALFGIFSDIHIKNRRMNFLYIETFRQVTSPVQMKLSQKQAICSGINRSDEVLDLLCLGYYGTEIDKYIGKVNI